MGGPRSGELGRRFPKIPWPGTVRAKGQRCPLPAGNPPQCLKPKGSVEHLSSSRLSPGSPGGCRQGILCHILLQWDQQSGEDAHPPRVCSERRAAASTASPWGGRVGTGLCRARQGPLCGCHHPRLIKGSGRSSCCFQTHGPTLTLISAAPGPSRLRDPLGRQDPGARLRLGQGGRMTFC